MLWPKDAASQDRTGMGTPRSDRGDGHIRLTDVTKPSIRFFPAPVAKKPGPAVILCPGGGYNYVVTTKMESIAKWLNQHGVSAFILIYRTPKKRKDAFEDIQRAVRIVRSRASEWKIDPKRIGVMGSSAGGHLAARVSTGFDIQTYQKVDKHDDVSCKPDFTVLLYPAYMNKGKELSKEFTVSSEISPTLIVTAKDDKGFFPGSPIYANALEDAGASVRTHFFEKGGHGFTLRPKQYPLSTWPDLFLQWLKDNKVIEKETQETDFQAMPPIQFAEGEKHFTAANQERVDIVRQIPGLVALWDFVQRRDSWQDFIGRDTLAHPGNPFIS
ncbi:MAG: alpha/beta hydrolase, partial [Verrucomicrobiota bacterium]|nr:alpha/beta hydrolase [Verrucomicrobiota bacterium]